MHHWDTATIEEQLRIRMKFMQVAMQTVLEVENLKPLVLAQSCSLFKQCCRCLSIIWVCLER